MFNHAEMIIACPACKTRYAVPDSAIDVDGRTVRYAKCRHSWFQEGAPIEAAVPPPSPPPPPAPQPSPAPEAAPPASFEQSPADEPVRPAPTWSQPAEAPASAPEPEPPLAERS